MSEYKICDEPGPCWDGYVYIGPKPKTRGSCIKKSKLCKKKSGKGINCLSKLSCNVNNKDNDKDVKNKKSNKEYDNCLVNASKRFNNGKLSLCPEGYCTAKQKFEVYPSAYANGYASQVCKGKKPNYYGKNIVNKKINKPKHNSLQRWFKEEWVNVCEKGNGPGGYAICGSGKGVKNIKKYPYCRAYYKLPGTTVVTAQELTKKEIKLMCAKKRSKKQGIDGKPTRIILPKKTRDKIKDKRKKIKKQKGGGMNVKIPKNVRDNALLGIKLLNKGFKGGTNTGWNRAKQLAYDEYIDSKSLADMRTWFARHGPDAKNGGTSYPGYCKWVKDGMPMNKNFSKYRGAVSWLIWGGNAAYKWLKSNSIRKILEKDFPRRKKSPTSNNLIKS